MNEQPQARLGRSRAVPKIRIRLTIDGIVHEIDSIVDEVIDVIEEIIELGQYYRIRVDGIGSNTINRL